MKICLQGVTNYQNENHKKNRERRFDAPYFYLFETQRCS